MRCVVGGCLFLLSACAGPASAEVRHLVVGLSPGTAYTIVQGSEVVASGQVPDPAGCLAFVAPFASPISILPSGVPGDLVPPAAPSNLQVLSATQSGVVLSWTAPGDDGLLGVATLYDARMSTFPITGWSFFSATQLSGEPAPAAPGTVQSMTVSGLSPGTTYYFAIRARDEAFNWSPVSNVVSVMLAGAPTDLTPPARITDLAASASAGSVTLSWTAPGDDGSVGTASIYDIRASARLITETNFTSAAVIAGAPTPLPAGSRQTATLPGFSPDARYYFAIKTADEVPNWSDMSNVALVSPAASPDTIPPDNITDIRLDGIGHRFAKLSWTAAADDEGSTLSAYEGRVAEQEIRDETAWLGAARVEGLPRPSSPGARDSVTVTGLAPARRYHIALRTRDAAGNLSLLGPQVAVTTTSAPDTLPPEAITSLAVVSATWTTLRIQWVAPNDRVPEDCVLPPRVDRYELRYGLWPPPADIWTLGYEVPAGTPGTPGSVERIVITGLSPESDYFVAIRSRDARGLWSETSNIVRGTTLSQDPSDDTTPPRRVTDLAAVVQPGPSITLSWTAPGDDDSVGTATAYAIRSSGKAITEASFDSATVIALVPAPLPAGSRQTVTLAGFHPDARYYFALKAADEVPNWSAVSNLASVSTAGPPDTLSPYAITDYTVTRMGHRFAHLAWTAPADRGGGDLAVYEGRYAEHEIYNEIAWLEAAQIEGLPVPSTPGGRDSVVVTGLQPARRYDLVIRARDDAGNLAPLEDGVAFSTTSAPDTIPPQAVATLVLASATSSTLRIRWLAPRDSVPEDCVERPRVDRYELRYGPWPPPANIWEMGLEAVTGTPGPPGATEEALITGLTPASEYYVVIRSRDARGRWSEISNVVRATTTLPILTGDTTPPGPAANLAASAISFDTVLLTWTAPGDDGDQGQAEYYDVRRASRALTPAVWPMGIRILPIKPCLPAGEPESLRVSGLQADRTHYFALRAVDPAGNIGPISISVSATTPAAPDTIPPRAVTDLAATVVDSVTALLTWTAPRDDLGECTAYSMRRAFGPIDEGSWTGADSVPGLGAPRSPGAAESLLVSALPQGRVVVFALRTKDSSGNWSGVSNLCPVVADSTDGGPPGDAEDRTAPAAIVDLEAEAVDATRVRLTWTAVGDDGRIGVAAFYEGRRAMAPIDSAGWASARVIEIPFQPDSAGAAETLLVSGLEPGSEHHFVIRARDESGNLSPLSAGAAAVTPAQQDLAAPAAPADLAAAQDDDAVLLSWAPSAEEDLAGYTVFRRSPNGAAETSRAGSGAAAGYRDTTVVPGNEYVYAVAAVDTAGNVSPKSAEVRVTPARAGFLPVITDLAVTPPALEVLEDGRSVIRLAWSCRIVERFGRFVVDGRPEERTLWERESAAVGGTGSRFEFSKISSPGRYRFRVVAVSPRGYESEICQIQVVVEAPSAGTPAPPLVLGAPFPNPTSGIFSVQASVPAPLQMRVRLFDARARLCAVLFDAAVAPGPHSWEWDTFSIPGRSLASGVYYVEMTLGGDRRVHKLVVQR